MSRWLAIANGMPEGAPSAPIANKVSLVSFVGGGHGEKSLPHGGPIAPILDPHAVDERAAIMMAGGMPQGWAEGFARLDPDAPPDGLLARDWLALLDQALMLADAHGPRLAGLGWGFTDLFATPETWVRQDQKGAGWFVCRGELIDATDTALTFKRGEQRYTFRKLRGTNEAT